MDDGLKHHLGVIHLGAVLDANNHGAKLGAKIYGAKVPARSPPRLRQAQDLGAKIYDADTCKLGATKGPDFESIPPRAYL